MAVKIFFLILLACLGQEYNAKEIIFQLETTPTNVQVVNHISNFEEFKNAFENFFQNLDFYSLNCYQKFIEYFEKINRVFAKNLKKLGTDCEKRFAGKFEEAGKNLQLFLNTMADLTETYPDIMFGLIHEDEYEKGIMYLNEVLLHFEFLEDRFLAEVKEFKKKYPYFGIKSEKTEARYEEILNKAKLKGTYVYKLFQRCLKSKPISEESN